MKPLSYTERSVTEYWIRFTEKGLGEKERNMATRKSQCQDSNEIKRKRKRMHSFEIHSKLLWIVFNRSAIL